MNKNKFNELVIEDAVNRIEECCAELTQMVMKMPHLHIIATSNDGPSEVYMTGKISAAAKFGLEATKHVVTPDTIMTKLTELSKDLNNKIIIQLPLGNQEDYPRLAEMLELIHPMQDVDGFTVPMIDINSMDTANDFITHPTFSPTAKGVLLLNMMVDDVIKGKEVAIVGKGLTSGLPITTMYNQLGATVHTINSKTKADVKYKAFETSDIIVSCAGSDMTILESSHLYADKICINVGMRRENNKLVGDLDYDTVSKYSKFINPVKGSTGKLTTLFLMYNCLASQMTHELITYNDTLKRNDDHESI